MKKTFTAFRLKSLKVKWNFSQITIFSLVLFCAIFMGISCKKERKEIPTIGDNSQYDKLGCGYDATKEMMTINSVGGRVIDITKLDGGRIYISNLEEETFENFVGENAAEYIKSVSVKVKLSVLGGLFKSSLSYFDSSTYQSDYIFASHYDYIRKKQLRLVASIDLLKSALTESFKSDVRTQSADWLVKNYGTCVLVNIVLGGRLEVVYRSRTTNIDKRGSASAGLSASMKSLFDIDISPGQNSSLAQSNTDQQLYYRTLGGNASLGLVGELNLGPSAPSKIQISQWHNSISLENAQLIDIGSQDGMILLSDLIDDPTKSAEVKAYIEEYLLANQIVIGDPPKQVYCYQEPINSKHAYSLDDVPSIKGIYQKTDLPFKAPTQEKDGAIPIYEQYDAAKNVFIYTQSSSAEPGFAVVGIAFYAFKNQVAGTVPCYEFYYEWKHNKKLYYDYWYSTSQYIAEPSTTHFMRVAFYVYP